ncbi:MAG: dihydroorotate dehydrogenase electron transfer subunit [Candidatus Omnitrophica bacterium]|nr:dihydroorotate dehydrogenase electron transfer subunit [Candidatus Omnitrophota bacterium]
MLERKALIVENKQVAPGMFWLELAAADIPAQAVPGQFIHVRVASTFDPLLRRPLSIAKRIVVDDDSPRLGIAYRVVGRGTQLLAEKRLGEQLDILGPLGNGFALAPLLDPDKPLYIVGGGMGFAPLIFLTQWLSEQRNGVRPTVCIGMDTARNLICLDEFANYGAAIFSATDDGSHGFAGYVTTLFEHLLARQVGKTQPARILACGPMNMLHAVRALADTYALSGQVSVDEMMGCGIGACLGCVIKVRDAGAAGFVYKRICADGPVFDIRDICRED